jgi:pimeloyl-ACP methyl ester carboxylesterase
MGTHSDGFATLDEAAAVISDYYPERRRPSSSAGLRKNLRLRDDGRWYWHWDPRFLGDPPRRTDQGRLESAAAKVRRPVMLVRGLASDVVTDQVVDDLATILPQTLVLSASAGHMIVGDDNAAFGEGLAGFLASLPPVPPPRRV